MPTRELIRITLLALTACLFASEALAQTEPFPLKQTVLAAPVGNQTSASFGWSIATSDTYTVVGAVFADTGAERSGVVQVFDAVTGESLHFLRNPAPAFEDFFGVSVAVSGTRVVVGAYRDDSIAAEAGTVYVYDMASNSPTVPVLTIPCPVQSTFHRFGFSVAIDGTRLVVGARTAGGANTGRAYVYDLAGSTPTLPAITLFNPSPEPNNDEFGTSVAISGNKVIVGSPYDDAAGPDAGSAYVFDLTSQTPTVPAVSLFPTAVGREFGRSVSVFGDHAVVGAPHDATGGVDTGSAYVYDLASETPSLATKIFTNPTSLPDEYYGWAVATNGEQLIIGAADIARTYVYDLADEAPISPVPGGSLVASGYSVAISATRAAIGTRSSVAYSVDLSSNPIASPTVLKSAIPSAGDKFGTSVVIDGSLMVVSAPAARVDGALAVFVYDLASGDPSLPTAILKNPAGNILDGFGNSIAISGSRIAVGSSINNTGATGAGRAYVFDIGSANPTTPAVIFDNPSPVEQENFGNAVAISGTQVVIGCAKEGTAGVWSGIAYVYDLARPTPNVPAVTLIAPDAEPYDQFGTSVGISGNRVLIGAPFKNTGAIQAGCIYAYDLTTGTPSTSLARIDNPAPDRAGVFGSSMAVGDEWFVIGAPSGRGVVFGYQWGASSLPRYTATIENPSSSNFDFGRSIAISGTRVVIGMPLDDSPNSDSGIVVVHDLMSTTPGVPLARIKNPTAFPNDRFGSGVAFRNNVIAVGAPFDDSSATDKGSVYTFEATDIATSEPVLTGPISDTFVRDSLNVQFTLPEQALPGSVTLTLEGAATITLTLASSQETPGLHSFSFDPSNPTLSPQIASGDPIPDGNYTITLSYRDALGNAGKTASVAGIAIDSVAPILPVTEKFLVKGDGVPGAGTLDGPPAGATLASFGVPAIDPEGHLVFSAKWTSDQGSGSGIFRDDTLIAKAGGAVPGISGATFKSFTEPVIDSGHVALLVTAAGVPKTRASVLVSDVSGTLETLAQTGTSAPGTGEATFKSFKSISVSGNAVGALAQLTPGTGAPRTTAVNDLGLWVKEGANPLVLALREGQEVAPGKKIKTLVSFAGGNGSPGQGRGWLVDTGDNARVLALTTLSDRSQAIVAVALDDLTNPTILVQSGAGSSFASLGLPTTNAAAQTAFLGSLVLGDEVTKTNSRGIFADLNGSGTYLTIARVSKPTSHSDVTFGLLKDPVLAADGGIAFVATLKGTTVKGPAAQTLWWQPPGGQPSVLAHGGNGATPADIPGAQWKSFPSLAIAANRGPIFTGTLVPGKGGVTKATSNGLWATDFEGNLRLLVQSGVTQIDGKTVKSFTLLNANVGSQGSTRSFNDNAFVVWRATFDDKSQAIVKTEVP